ncbi:Cro/C1-type helix-turn-helix domain [Moorella glycerini]|uniref:HTH-type transcriptional regulator SinR n=1 Tax=Neomoorella stamsii TaxID=1266720 RepID=A0A9X7J0I3_9FIRM|nr:MULTISPECIES: helix-turn-helix transcriptional regulator [Moorella]PRR69638.1 HTH-type transcriptional regulator SinR [Moorella stamsii]CEP67838.1 Cro/C1-type helix-turn-helix domain [Moorella glycerini]
MDFGARIKQLRETAGLSQNELARRAGIAQSSLSYLETGAKSPNVETLLHICKALGITVSEFLGENEGQSLPADLRQLLREAEGLTPEQRRKLIEFIRSMKE